MKWNLLAQISAPMPFQLALDELLFRHACENVIPADVGIHLPLFRFYYSSEPWITVGYSHFRPSLRGCEASEAISEIASSPADKSRRAPRNDGHIARRITGGGRVEHGKDLLFTFIAKKEHDESFRSVRISYLKIHEAVKLGLERLGVSSRFYRCDENLPRGPECFMHPIATDLAWKGRKIAGGAQKRSHGFLLHQESILLPEREPGSMIDALKLGFQKIFGIEWQSLDLNPNWLDKAKNCVIPAKAGIHSAMDPRFRGDDRNKEADERTRILS